MLHIEILYTQGCPAKDKALDAIREVLDEKKVDGSIEERLITTSEEALNNRFLGSPTIKINGLDLEPSARNLSQTGLG